MITAQIDTSGMDEVLSKLAAATNLPMRDVTLAESRAIIQTCHDRTKLHTKSYIDARSKRKFNRYSGGAYGRGADHSYPRISICARAGNTWWVEAGPKFYIMQGGNRRWSDPRWAAYQSEEVDRKADLLEHVQEQRRRRGLPKHTWYFLADLIGFEIRSTQEVMNAQARKKQVRAANAVVRSQNDIFQIDCSIWSIATIRKSGPEILSAAIQGRVKYFRRNLKMGVFDSFEKVAARYPQILKINRDTL